MSEIARWADSGREGIRDLAAWADHRRRVGSQNQIAARTIAEINAASAIWNETKQYPRNSTVAWLRDRYVGR
ncbi:hypothetical protein [Cryobacterium sp. MDB2-33-2]|uniref:hypothetical protein n=1 Tax=Cryobacterium sp. MDB2-33-2 TaxID=1259179 RepID=UPI0010697021|nr:hypothetical protein [Cryobacterium sp. MDB2-33-2]TFC05064.1 hypothetical protein E3O59_13070 [Cryobacterium sp. MDB2-33-2]